MLEKSKQLLNASLSWNKTQEEKLRVEKHAKDKLMTETKRKIQLLDEELAKLSAK